MKTNKNMSTQYCCENVKSVALLFLYTSRNEKTPKLSISGGTYSFFNNSIVKKNGERKFKSWFS